MILHEQQQQVNSPFLLLKMSGMQVQMKARNEMRALHYFMLCINDKQRLSWEVVMGDADRGQTGISCMSQI